MKAIAEVQIIPIGVGVSVRKEVMRAHELLEESGLNLTLHANGSNLEGELEEVMSAIRTDHRDPSRRGRGPALLPHQDRNPDRQGSQHGGEAVQVAPGYPKAISVLVGDHESGGPPAVLTGRLRPSLLKR